MKTIETKETFLKLLPKPEVADKEFAKICLLRTLICRNPTFNCGSPTVHCLTLTRTCLDTICKNFTLTCPHNSLIGCTIFHSCGGPGGSACDTTYICPGGSVDPFVIEHMEDLVTLKSELQATLKSLDAIQKEGLPSAIGSKAEAEALERSLTEALEKVRAAKKNL